MIVMFWILIIVGIVIYAYMKNKESEEKAKIQEQHEKDIEIQTYTSKYPNDFHFSSDLPTFLEEIDYVTHDIAVFNRNLKYIDNSFIRISLMIEGNVQTDEYLVKVEIGSAVRGDIYQHFDLLDLGMPIVQAKIESAFSRSYQDDYHEFLVADNSKKTGLMNISGTLWIGEEWYGNHLLDTISSWICGGEKPVKVSYLKYYPQNGDYHVIVEYEKTKIAQW